MKTKIKKLIPWIFSIFVILTIAATTKQLIGPTTATTTHAIARWTDTTSYKLTNSLVTIDDYGSIFGINTQSMVEADIATGLTTNGLVYLLKGSAPVAADIGGTVGSITNYMLVNFHGIFTAYWSDGTTLYSKQLSP